MDTKDTTHLVELQARVMREKARLAAARSEKERTAFQVRVEMAERELAGEFKFLGLSAETASLEISDEELMAELEGL